MSMDELFAEAIERLQAGESLDAIVAPHAPLVEAELRALLAVVDEIGALAAQPVPQRSATRRSAFRAQFLVEAAAREAELQAAQSELAPAGRASAPPPPSAWARLLERTEALWQSFAAVPVLRLAPLAMVLILVALVTSWTVVAAEATLPWEPIFPIKQWMRDQRIQLAPPSLKEYVIELKNQQILKELEEVTKRQSEAPQKNLAPLVQQLTEDFIYYGETGKLLVVGPLKVIPQYQPDPNRPESVAMEWIGGEPSPGSTVHLTFQMMPGLPNTVQGVRLEVLSGIAPVPPPQPTATATQAPGAFPPECVVTPPDDWVSKLMLPGATVNSVAAKYGLNLETLMRVNCLQQGDTPDRIFVPLRNVAPWTQATPLPALPPSTEGQQPVQQATATLVPTSQPTSAPDNTATPVPTEPTATPNESGTPAATVEATATAVLTATESAGTPTATVEATATTELTSTESAGTPTATVEATATTELTSTESAGTPTATVEATATTELTSTESAGMPTATVETTATTELTSTEFAGMPAATG